MVPMVEFNQYQVVPFHNSDKKITLIRVAHTVIVKTITHIGQFWTCISSALALGINTHVSSIVDIGGRDKPIVRIP